MGVEVAKPLRLKRGAGRPVPLGEAAKPKSRVSKNALIGMGLWFLLWSGYNTDIVRFLNPNFPTNTMDLIHGVRAFFPMLAGWFACLLIFSQTQPPVLLDHGPVGVDADCMPLRDWFLPRPSQSTRLYALYYGANYLAIVLVLLAIVLVEDPLPDLLKVLRFTWNVGTVLTLSLLGAIPILGSQVIIPSEGNPLDMRAYGGLGTVMGMASTRNTGFARYAAISALAALPGVHEEG